MILISTRGLKQKLQQIRCERAWNILCTSVYQKANFELLAIMDKANPYLDNAHDMQASTSDSYIEQVANDIGCHTFGDLSRKLVWIQGSIFCRNLLWIKKINELETRKSINE